MWSKAQGPTLPHTQAPAREFDQTRKARLCGVRHKDLLYPIPRRQLGDLTKQGKLDDEAQSTFVSNVSPTPKDIKVQIIINNSTARAQELRESGDGRSGLPVPNSLYGLCRRKTTLNERKGRTELRSCVKAEVVVLGSTTLIVRMLLYILFFIDVKQQ